MGGRASAASVALLLVVAWLLTPALAPAQTDLAKVLIGTWRGELVARIKRGSDAATPLALRIASVKLDDGRWVAEGRFGPNPVKIDVDTSGSKPSLRWTGAAGTTYNLTLFNDNTLVGTATLTMEQAQSGMLDRDRPVKLEKQ